MEAKVKRLLAIDAFGDEFTVADLLDDTCIDEVTHQLGGAEVVVCSLLSLILLGLELLKASHLGPHVILPIQLRCLCLLNLLLGPSALALGLQQVGANTMLLYSN